MPTANIYSYVEVVGTTTNKTIGSKGVPLSIALDATAPQVHHDVHYLVTATLKEIFRFGAADGDDTVALPKVIAILPAVDTKIVIVGTATTDNSLHTIEAGHLHVISGGTTSEYAATYTGRAAAAAQNITKIYAIQSSGATAKVEILAAF